jgi:hypothetical protein
VGDIPKDQRVGNKIKGYASGTPSAPAGWAWVGEKGPELMKLKGGEAILNSMESARAAGARSGAGAVASGGGATVVHVQAVQSHGTGLEALFWKWFNDRLATGAIKFNTSTGRLQPA